MDVYFIFKLTFTPAYARGALEEGNAKKKVVLQVLYSQG